MENLLKMADHVNGIKDTSVKPEWFLKRCGSYVDDLIIELDQDELVIGRGSNKALKHSPGVSRKHVCFKKTNNGHWLVQDLSSTNGTYVNRKKIATDHLEPIKEYDIIGFGVSLSASNDQFSFMLCRRINIKQEQESNYKEASISAQESPLESEQSYKSALDKIKGNKNIKLENSSNDDSYNVKQSKSSNTEPSVIAEHHVYENILGITDNKTMVQNNICELDKFNCKVLVERCDEKISKFNFLHSMHDRNKSLGVNLTSHCDRTAKEDACNTSRKQELEDGDDDIQFVRITPGSRKTVIISDTDDDDDDDDGIFVPQTKSKPQKRKIIISSEESSVSSDELLPKGAFSTKTDVMHQMELKNEFFVANEESIDDLDNEHQREMKNDSVSRKEGNLNDLSGEYWQEVKNNVVTKEECTIEDVNDEFQREMKNGTVVRKESNLKDLQDKHYQEVKNDIVVIKRESNADDLNGEVQLASCSLQCDIRLTENKIFLAANISSKIKPELKYPCTGNNIPTASAAASNDSPVNSMLKCKSENDESVSNVDEGVRPEKTVEKYGVSNQITVLKHELDVSKAENVAVEEENFSYSQSDNIIILSDDEDLPAVKVELNKFLDANKGNNTDLIVKKEPKDEELQNWEKIYAQRNCSYDCDKNGVSCDDEISMCESEVDYMGFSDNENNVDEKVLLARLSWPPAPDDEEEEKTTENDFFPSLSQSFFSDDSTSQSSDDADLELVSSELQLTKSKTEETPLPKNDFGNKPAVQTIEALPMLFRPKCMRGREEWFTERTVNRPQKSDNSANKGSTTNKDTQSEIVKTKFYGKAVYKKLPAKGGNKRKKVPSLKDKLKENMGHRVRCPGGGSAIVKQDTSARAILNNSSAMSKNSRTWSTNVTDTVKKLPIAAINTCSASKSKNVNSAQLIQRFPSRAEQLTKTMLGNDSSCNKNKRGKQQGKLAVDLPEKQKPLQVSRKQHLDPKMKHRKRENPFANFKIPKKKRTEDWKESSLDEQASFRSSDEKKTLDENRTSVQFNSVRVSRGSSSRTNTCVVSTFQDKICRKGSTWDPQIKKVRFAEKTVCERKDISPTPVSSAAMVKSCMRNNSSILDVSTEQASNMVHVVSQECVIATVLLWNTNWLKEQCATSLPPPVVNFESLKKVSWQYASAMEHWNTYFSLLCLEMWQSVYQAWRDSGNWHTYEFCIVHIQKFNNMMILKCQMVVPITRKEILTYMEGHFAIVELVLITKDQATAMVKSFGYICDCRLEWYRTETAHPLLHPFASNTAGSFNLVNFVLKIKYREDDLKISRLMKVTPCLYLKPFLRQCEALQNAYDCSLGQCILHPQHKLCSFDVSESILRSTLTYNEKQKHAILGISSAMLEPTEPRLLLLHGPPGTGKTHTIVGIVEQLLFRCVRNAGHPMKLLIAAPSNAAVDEIGRRLLKLRPRLVSSNGKRMKFVRVGQANMVHKELKGYFLDELVKTNLKNMENDLEITLNHLQAKINKLQHEFSSRKERNPYDPAVAKKQEELSRARKELQSCKSTSDGQGLNSAKQKRKLVIDILKNADIILSTLNSCRQAILESAFGKNSSVSLTCCIIDEATQCMEPEVLLPLCYGMKKVLLVGDPQQLPATVFSRLAVQYGLNISLFERLKNYFDTSSGENPVFMLTDQHRMHPEICSYPSSQFYSNMLKSCGINHYFQRFPLKRYLILDIMDGQECTDDPSKIYNRAEANFVEFLCSETLRLIPSTCTLGVITPYQGQRRIISDYFDSTMAQEKHRLEVNTVDGFQGRERDVIILSCVRAGCSGTIGFLDDRQRLNVAITRARYSLIICGHMSSLRSHQLWGSLIRNAELRKLLFAVRSSDLELVYHLLKAESEAE